MGNLCTTINNENNILDKEFDFKLKLKKIIWNASLNLHCILIEMKDSTLFVGRPNFYYDEDYSKLPKGDDMTYIHFKLLSGVPLHYHIGGENKPICFWDISDIIVMNKDEIDDYNISTNFAPLFVKRLFQYD